MKYIKKFENNAEQTKKDIENSKKFIIILYYGTRYEIIEIKHIREKENDVEAYYYDNYDFTKSDFLSYQDFIVIQSFDTFDDALKKYREIIELKNTMHKYNI